MAKKGKIYRCSTCGNIIEVLHEGQGTLVCCGKDMEILEEKSKEEGLEKHLPEVKIEDNNVKVTVGSILHPMEDSHYIQFIELIFDENRIIKYLKPQESPMVEFKLDKQYTNIKIRAYCNIHGLWISN